MNGAQFAGILCQQIYDERKEHLNLPAERKKKIKIPEEEIGLEPERVHARKP